MICRLSVEELSDVDEKANDVLERVTKVEEDPFPRKCASRRQVVRRQRPALMVCLPLES